MGVIEGHGTAEWAVEKGKIKWVPTTVHKNLGLDRLTQTHWCFTSGQTGFSAPCFSSGARQPFDLFFCFWWLKKRKKSANGRAVNVQMCPIFWLNKLRHQGCLYHALEKVKIISETHLCGNMLFFFFKQWSGKKFTS